MGDNSIHLHVPSIFDIVMIYVSATGNSEAHRHHHHQRAAHIISSIALKGIYLAARAGSRSRCLRC